MLIEKPKVKGYLLVTTHGWHMSMPKYEPEYELQEEREYLIVHVDMRGRAFSQGTPDCNSKELIDILDAAEYAKGHYSDYLLSKKIVYFEGGSGGGGNALALAGKCPDYFAAVTSLFGISDYAEFYLHDKIGEFRDELDIWIGGAPDNMPEAYMARSGLTTVENLMCPLYIAHGEKDERALVQQSREYVKKAHLINKAHLIEYTELAGVGNREHLGNATLEQEQEIQDKSEELRKNNRTVTELSMKGKLVVAGYLITRQFSIYLEDMNKVAMLEYDLRQNHFKLYCKENIRYKIERY